LARDLLDTRFTPELKHLRAADTPPAEKRRLFHAHRQTARQPRIRQRADRGTDPPPLTSSRPFRHDEQQALPESSMRKVRLFDLYFF
jgi:hypothetical protein